MKKMVILFCAFALFGCTYQGTKLADYVDDPKSIIKDPHFAAYKAGRDDLESQYVRKEIAYDEFLRQRDDLDNAYAREVQARASKIGFGN